MKNKPKLTIGLNGFYFIVILLAVVMTLNFSYAGDLIKGGDRYKPAKNSVSDSKMSVAPLKETVKTDQADASREDNEKRAQAASGADRTAEVDAPSKAKYMGAAVCVGCHKAVSDEMKNSFHFRPSKQSNIEAEKNNCEGCHGPASEHVNSGGKKEKILSYKIAKHDKKVDSCLACHARGEVMQFGVNAHNLNNISCDSCHKIHTKKEEANWKKDAKVTCVTCHKDVEMESKLPSRHPVRDERMSCVDCHNAHGAGEKMLKANSSNELCKSCHAQNATAHVYAHPPVNENCLNCHKPHGSANRGLLTQRVPMLCLQCHGNVSPAHDITVRNRQDCTNNQSGCHGDIHGSNSNNLLLK